MSISQTLESAVLEHIRTLGDSSSIKKTYPLGGGCINQAVRVETEHKSYMLKWNSRTDLDDMFPTEAEGLLLLRSTETVIVPEPYIARNAVAGHTPAYILMEWIAGSNSHTTNQELLGQQLAHMHIKGTSPNDPPAYGLGYDNYIGSTPQANGWYTDWVAFYQEKRLRPQIVWAERKGYMPSSRKERLERLIERLDTWLGGVNRQPALLHGDLWGGNVLAASGGKPALIDPAVSYGDREAEIAYTELFGGFGERFYQAYHHTYPLEPGYADRRDLYNLYHLLNHLNLFGEMYGRQIDKIAQHYVG